MPLRRQSMRRSAAVGQLVAQPDGPPAPPPASAPRRAAPARARPGNGGSDRRRAGASRPEVNAAGSHPARPAQPTGTPSRASRAFARIAFSRSIGSSSTLRRRIAPGVTSTHSSSRTNSSASSSVGGDGGVEPLQLVRGRGADVRQVLLAHDVDLEVLARGCARRRSCRCRPPCRARRTACRGPAGPSARTSSPCPCRSATSEPVGRRRSGALPRLVAVEDVVEDPGAARLGRGTRCGSRSDRAPGRGIPSAPSRCRG